MPSSLPIPASDVFRFGPLGRFELQPRRRRLLVDRQPVALGGRALDVLIVLLAQQGRVVTRQQLLEAVWSDADVEENNLSVQISALRKVLGSDVLATVPGRGYSFTAALAAADAAPGAALPAPVPAAEAAPAAPPPDKLRSNLPAVLAPLIGRDDDLPALGALLDRHRLVTVIGAGGIGKTRLVQALLQARQTRPAHGVCFVELAAVRAPAEVPAAIAAALGMRLAAGDDPCEALARTVATLDLLLALDNAEHLLDAVAATAQAVLHSAPQVRLLVTSQAPLKLKDEWLFRLNALALPPAGVAAPEALLAHAAVALFVARAQAQDRRFALHAGNAEGIAELCRRLDGLPLAIELAAARLPLLGLARLTASLNERLLQLKSSLRDAPPRQQTLRAALEWSHGLLSPVQQTVFRRLAVFAGSAPLALLAPVLADAGADREGGLSPAPASALDEEAMLDALGVLVERSLVDLLDDGDDNAPRYRLLDAPQAYARQQLDAAGEAAALQRRHARALGRMFAQAEAALRADQVGYQTWRERLTPDVDNARLALNQALADGDAPLALGLAPVLSRVYDRNRHSEREALWQLVAPLLDARVAAWELAPDAAPAAAASLAWALLIRAESAIDTRQQQAFQFAQQSAALYAQAGDRQGRYLALCLVGWVHGRSGDRAALETVLTELRQLDDPSWPAFVQVLGIAGPLWWASVIDGDDEAALHWTALQIQWRRAAGHSDTIPLVNRAYSEVATGRLDDAIATCRMLVGRLGGSRDQAGTCYALLTLTDALLRKPAPAEAREALRASWPLAGLLGLLSYATDNAAMLALLEDRPRAALRLLGRADADIAAAAGERASADQTDRSEMEARARAALAGRCDAVGCDRLLVEGATLAGDGLTAVALGTDDD